MTASKAFTAVLVATAALAEGAQAQTSSCTSDTDCATGMACRTQTVTTCTGGTTRIPCSAGAVCDPVKIDPPVCSESTLNQCVCQWPQPCSGDGDCDSAFFCQPTTRTMCSADGGPSTPPACTTSTAFPGTCQPKVPTCNSDADCPSPWTCVAVGPPVTVASPDPIDAGVVVQLPPEIATDTDTNTATSPVKTCQSPCGRTYGGSDSTQGSGALTASLDAGAGRGTTPTMPPVVAPSNEGSGTSRDLTDTKPATATKTGGSGCNVGAGKATGGATFVLSLLLCRLGCRRRGRSAYFEPPPFSA